MDKHGAHTLVLTSPASRGRGSNPGALRHDRSPLPNKVVDRGVHRLADRLSALYVALRELLRCELEAFFIGRVEVMQLRVRSGARDSLQGKPDRVDGQDRGTVARRHGCSDRGLTYGRASSDYENRPVTPLVLCGGRQLDREVEDEGRADHDGALDVGDTDVPVFGELI